MLEAGTGMREGPRVEGGTNYKAGRVFTETLFRLRCDCLIITPVLQMRNIRHQMLVHWS